MADAKTTALSELTTPTLEDLFYMVDDPSGTPASRKATLITVLGEGGYDIPGGRLTLTTVVPVTTADVTAATTIYYTPYIHDKIRLYDGTTWKLYVFSEINIAVPATTTTMYDVWAYDSGGSATLEVLAWTDDTNRATALAYQDGVLVKSGVTTKRYLGSFRTTGASGETEDSGAKRFVWNYYNRISRNLLVIETTDSWTYGTATWRSANNSASNRIEAIQGVAEDIVQIQVLCLGETTGEAGSVGIGIDSTSANSAQLFMDVYYASTATTRIPMHASYEDYPAAGYHYYQWIEYARTGTFTFIGDFGTVTNQSGMKGIIRG